jgi:hypothetical protein
VKLYKENPGSSGMTSLIVRFGTETRNDGEGGYRLYGSPITLLLNQKEEDFEDVGEKGCMAVIWLPVFKPHEWIVALANVCL